MSKINDISYEEVSSLRPHVFPDDDISFYLDFIDREGLEEELIPVIKQYKRDFFDLNKPNVRRNKSQLLVGLGKEAKDYFVLEQTYIMDKLEELDKKLVEI